jgi:glutamine---fructose-6-phosphate transaminase (isomerizing)
MCGIVGYVGDKKCKSFILDGLTRLEYRGYDSAGFACIDSKHKHVSFVKKAGTISCLKEELLNKSMDGFVGLGHTRWATHGAADDDNAHPHFSCKKDIALVHNGIIESYVSIRKKLKALGHEFYSETDSEVVVHLLEENLKHSPTLKLAVMDLIKQLKGVFAVSFFIEEFPDQLIVIRYKSPLAIGVGENEMFVASDPIAFSGKTDNVLFLPDCSFAFIKKDSIQLFDFDGKELPIKTQKLDLKFSAATKQGFEHFMLKEIYEQKKAIDKSISFYKKIGSSEYSSTIWRQFGLDSNQVENLKSIHMVAAGTSWHAGKIAQYFFETVCKIPAFVHLSSEFAYNQFFPPKDALFIFISQSGETADTLEALRRVNSHGIPTVALTNSPSSTMVREAGGFLLMQAGPEISVASTKAFTSQLASLHWLANRIALKKNLVNSEEMKKSEEDLFIAAEVLESTIEEYKWDISNKLAQQYSQYDQFIFLGRNLSYPLAMEAALKLKEISYRFAQSYPAGELKHGPIALVDEKTPVVVFSLLDDVLYQKLVSNVQEVCARKGRVIVFAFEGQDELIDLAETAFVVPKVQPLLAPLAMSGIMQFFIYHITKQLGCPIDKPRNLAKSVTVE